MKQVQPTTIFMHLPKTAGSSLQAALEACYTRESICKLEPDPRDAAKGFVCMPLDQRQQVRLLSGHQLFGLHRHANPGARYIALLRDPLMRAVSDLNHRKRTKGETLSSAELCDALAGHPAEGLATRDNLYTRWLAAEPGQAEVYEDRIEPDENAYERAKQNVKTHFACLGVTEHFFVSAAMISQALSIEFDRMPRLNVSPVPTRMNPEDPQWQNAMAAFRERNSYDDRLYADACERVEAGAKLPEIARAATQLEKLGRRVSPMRAWGYFRRHGVRLAARRAISTLRGSG